MRHRGCSYALREMIKRELSTELAGIENGDVQDFKQRIAKNPAFAINPS
jgi:hypothetical protein